MSRRLRSPLVRSVSALASTASRTSPSIQSLLFGAPASKASPPNFRRPSALALSPHLPSATPASEAKDRSGQSAPSKTNKSAASSPSTRECRHLKTSAWSTTVSSDVEVKEFVDPNPAHNLELLPKMRVLEEAPPDVRGFSDVSHPDAIRSICHTRIPGWGEFPPEAIVIHQLCEGLSNQNFKVHLAVGAQDLRGSPACVLFRIYGRDSQSLYDGDVELKIVTVLSAYGIAPRIYSHGNGWRIEEWHFSVPLQNRSMRNPSIFVQVAASFGRLHKLSARLDFPDDIKGMQPRSFARLDSWGQGCTTAMEAFTHPDRLKGIEQLDINEFLAESEWLKAFLVHDDPKIHGSGLDTVFAHWDAQENNILQTLSGLRWIDFEYSGMDYQAWDIACYFVECTIDYIVDQYPFYKVSLSDFPSEVEQRLFCSIYLSEYLETNVRPNDLAVSVLLERVRRFTLASHLLWSMWSVIRANQAPTFSEFDYLHYAQTRWFMYKWSKRALLQGNWH